MARLTDISCTIVAETEKAIAVADGTMEKRDGREQLRWYWLPKSLVEVDPSEFDVGDTVTVTLPERLATEKELL